MARSFTASRRSSKKQDKVLGHLRGRIIDGDWRPGDRIPTLRDLGESFDVSTVTVQKAIDQLSRDGYIRSENRIGMFVSDHPPCLNRFALVLPFRPRQNQHWSFYWEALTRSAVEVAKARGVQIVIHYEIDSRSHDSQDYDRLVRDVVTDSLAGIIFAHSPHTLRDTPVLDRKGIPRVAFMSEATEPGVSAVSPRVGEWFDVALAEFRKLGRKRVAVLFAAHEDSGRQPSKLEAAFAQAVRAQGMESRPQWIHGVLASSPRWAANLMQLMFDGDSSRWPDALLIADDNVAEHAQAGLINAGVRVPADVEVISLANFPCPPAAVLPIRRIGYDARAVLETCLDLLMAQRRGEEVAAMTPIAVVTEDESVASILKCTNAARGTN